MLQLYPVSDHVNKNMSKNDVDMMKLQIIFLNEETQDQLLIHSEV